MGLFGGRYGFDKLNRTIFWVSIGLNLLAMLLNLIFLTKVFTATRIIQGIALIMIVWALLRAFSKNFVKRERELAAYMRFENWLRCAFTRVKGKSRNVININEHKHYRHLTCPQCMQKLRVPRGKGKILVTCTKCRCKFEAKT
ncbi:MAG: hypothetical protein RR232_07585 [Clostridia bacterium]